MTKQLCYQAIVTSFYPPTNFKPARLKISASAGTKWESWDKLEGHVSDDSRHIAAARDYAKAKDWQGAWFMGGLLNGDRVFVCCKPDANGPQVRSQAAFNV